MSLGHALNNFARNILTSRSAIAGAGLLLAGALALPPAEAGPRMLVDVATGEVLDHEDAFQRWYPASLTKLMTTYVAFRMMETGEVEPTSPVTISRRAAAQPPSKMYYGEGATMTLDAAIKIIMVKSANDVAMAIGESLSGSEPAFVDRMNAEAQRLGMTATRFINAHGLPGEGQYTTARDMAILARAIKSEYPEHSSYFAIEAIEAGPNVYPNFNMLIGRFAGADGMKTGFICSSGFNQVSSASLDGRTVVSVVFGAESLAARAEESAQLLHQGLNRQATDANGSPVVTLATLAPYGENRDEVADIREEICSPAARTARSEGRDDEGELIIKSDHILPLTRDLKRVTVSLGGTGGRVATIFGPVPVPTPRPQIAEIGDSTGPTRSEVAANDPVRADRDGTIAELRQAIDVPLPTPRPAL